MSWLPRARDEPIVSRNQEDNANKGYFHTNAIPNYATGHQLAAVLSPFS